MSSSEKKSHNPLKRRHELINPISALSPSQDPQDSQNPQEDFEDFLAAQRLWRFSNGFKSHVHCVGKRCRTTYSVQTPESGDTNAISQGVALYSNSSNGPSSMMVYPQHHIITYDAKPKWLSQPSATIMAHNKPNSINATSKPTSNVGVGKGKGPRTYMTKFQRDLLQKQFVINPCPDQKTMMELAIVTFKSPKQISMWFTNARRRGSGKLLPSLKNTLS